MSIELLQKAVKAYYDGKPIMTDQEYDELYFAEKQKNPKDAFFKKVGTSDVGENKVKLSSKRGSLCKCNPETGLNWIAKHNNERFLITPKYDGLSITLEYDKNGDFVRATTRGDGYYGQDVSDRAKYFKGFKSHINPKAKISFVTGEAIISKKDFEKYAKEYANPRNLCVGKLKSKLTAKQYRSKSSKEDFDVLKDITFVAYTSNYTYKSKTLNLLTKLGFIVAERLATNLTAEQLTNSLIEKALQTRDKRFECDGIVIDIDSEKDIVSKYGYESDGITPSFAIAIKPTKANQDSAEAIIKKINWQINKTGNLIPVAVLEKPVNLKGATITNISLANYDRCRNEGFGEGATIRVVRSGDVIPYADIIKPVKLKVSAKCPFCGCKLSKKGVHLHCSNAKCEGRKLQALQNFFLKMGIENISYEGIAQLYNAGFDTIKKILRITKPQLLALDGWQETKANTLLKELCKIQRCELVTIMDASGIFNDSTTGLGRTILQSVIDSLGEKKILQGKVTEEDLQGVEHFGKGRIELFMNKYPRWNKFWSIYKDFFDIEVHKQVSGPLSGKTFCWTGFRDKALKEWIEKYGGVVKDSLTKSTDVLFSAGPSTKTRKAEQYGIKIVPQGEAIDYIKNLLHIK